ncbi:transcriptional regulator, GntR family [Devosia lucknowensis]|uniref:Transcriptional regulator, GntR family n=1 Tax=Devosia lucknowensis TaxID=1096929 RepID=A0A1Y6GDE5_9HYPH|nr:GntR family transcriptional regulator [Devosia lucknowensis]SMQ86099.1 transcriptional regulator, GntR family [Devosia lucknowensis]
MGKGIGLLESKFSTGELKPVSSRKTVHDLVYEQLRDALMSGAFEARKAFTIASLSERFHTSHMPVREALRRLASENALSISASGTAYVPAITATELRDITLARMIVEGATARIAGPRLTEADIVTLEQILAHHRASASAGTNTEMTAANRAFHFHIYQAAGSRVLLSQIENLWLRSGPYVRFLSDRMRDLLKTEHRAGFTDQHEAMIEAIRSRDWIALGLACEADIKGSQDLLLDILASEEETTGTP